MKCTPLDLLRFFDNRWIGVYIYIYIWYIFWIIIRFDTFACDSVYDTYADVEKVVIKSLIVYCF